MAEMGHDPPGGAPMGRSAARRLADVRIGLAINMVALRSNLVERVVTRTQGCRLRFTCSPGKETLKREISIGPAPATLQPKSPTKPPSVAAESGAH